ncbi:MAG: ribosomal protein S18-alanine N-acetyltransferase [Terracidiphilus sp.]
MSDPANEIRIRPMAASDLDHVLEIALSMPEAPHWPRSAYLRALDPESLPRRISLVAESRAAGKVAGFAVASVVAGQAELESIVVASDAQRRGLGRRIFSILIHELKRAGAELLILEVRASNAAALAFYRSLEFAETGRRSRYYIDPVEDAVLMALELG